MVDISIIETSSRTYVCMYVYMYVGGLFLFLYEHFSVKRDYRCRLGRVRSLRESEDAVTWQSHKGKGQGACWIFFIRHVLTVIRGLGLDQPEGCIVAPLHSISKAIVGSLCLPLNQYPLPVRGNNLLAIVSQRRIECVAKEI